VAGRWFSPGTPVSSANNSDRYETIEILFKVALSTITLPPPPKNKSIIWEQASQHNLHLRQRLTMPKIY
jgi:hypothetical protein